MADKADVIKWRDTLKAGLNLPLRIDFDNNYHADESIPLNYVKWDDTNGIIYIFRLSNLTDTTHPTNKQQFISVFSRLYDYIQYMEVAKLPLSKLDDLFNSIESSGSPFNGQFKDNIKHAFELALHTDRFDLSHNEINAMTGFKVENEKDNYYAGKFDESFKETREHARHNEYIKSLEESEEDSGNNQTDP